jgi:HD-GYP domain-containing protein (c-di-GMP phosphodiesterase class II)
MEELVKGVILARAGEAIDRAQGSRAAFSLIASWDGTEVIRQDVTKGARCGLHPAEGWQALECLYILSGEALWEDSRRRVILGPQDSLQGRPVQEPCILEALTDVVLLYICSQPVFHTMSETLAKYRQLAVSVEAKDGYTYEHCLRIQDLSVKVGRHLKLSASQLSYLLWGAFMHDLGKVGVPDEILQKPAKLTAPEWEVMKRHTLTGRDMLLNTVAAGAAPILEQHHERLDGSGYPYGLVGDQISLEAQIVAVVDSYDAMTTDRIYRKGIPKEDAISELRQTAGRLYRIDVVEAFLTVLTKESGEKVG